MARSSSRPEFRGLLMVEPSHFQVEYAINPYMTSQDGSLQKVDKTLAREQWETLLSVYRRLGFTPHIIPGVAGLPDMVFAANQSFPFWRDGDPRPSVLLSRMNSMYRQPEVAHFADWYRRNGWDVLELESTCSFEGNGDALLHPGRSLIWGGYGHRTDLQVYEEIEHKTGCEVIPLELVSEQFYHLDTCLTILDAKTCAFQPDAFTAAGRDAIRGGFERVIEVDRAENISCFAANAHSPDGRHVILHKGTERFAPELRELGYSVIEVDTSEFMKSGGSVFCMKMMIFT